MVMVPSDMDTVAYILNSLAWASVGYIAAIVERRIRVVRRKVDRIDRKLRKRCDKDTDDPT